MKIVNCSVFFVYYSIFLVYYWVFLVLLSSKILKILTFLNLTDQILMNKKTNRIF
jgi:hypothetical protein